MEKVIINLAIIYLYIYVMIYHIIDVNFKILK